jgi:sulfite exporter TauE/SafE
VNLGAVLVTGLFAGGVSCAAVQGGLLAGLVARQRATTTDTRADGGRVAVATGARREAAGRPAPAGKAGKAGPKTGSAGRQTPHAARRARTAPPPPAPLAARLADDLAPVGAFLTGKLVSHTLLGALLGALGTVVQFSPTLRAAAQLAAGTLIVAFGLAQLGVRGLRRFTIEPPAAWSRFVRGRARSQSAFAPALLGLATILVPCGVTLSVEALALTSGSAWTGAATMAVFVIGTSPLFAALGYAARKAATAWRGRLAVATGLVVVGLGLYTFNGGLTVLDSPLAANRLSQTLGFAPPPATAETVTTDTSGRQTAVLTATTGSYSPENIQVKAGVPTTLTVRADNAGGCIRAFIIRDKQYILPETGDTTIDLGVLAPGELDFRCGMGMYTGRLTIVA